MANPVQNPDPNAQIPGQTSGVRAESVQGDAYVHQNSDGKLSVFLVVWVAFYNSLKSAQNQAQIQTEVGNQLQGIQQDLITQLQGINYSTLPSNEAGSSSPNMGIITEVNNNNQVVQAHINIVQDKVGNVQQANQVLASQASTTAQSASQTMNTTTSIATLYLQIIQNITQA